MMNGCEHDRRLVPARIWQEQGNAFMGVGNARKRSTDAENQNNPK